MTVVVALLLFMIDDGDAVLGVEVQVALAGSNPDCVLLTVRGCFPSSSHPHPPVHWLAFIRS